MDILLIMICLVLAVASYIVSYFQFRERGFLFNNAYLYASAEERQSMNKTPHYRQSGVVFALIGTIFILNAIELIMGWHWMFYFVIMASAATLIYAVVSSIQISKKS